MAFGFFDSDITAEEVKRRRAMANALMARMPVARDVGSGLQAFGQGIASGLMARSARKGEEAGRASAKPIEEALMKALMPSGASGAQTIPVSSPGIFPAEAPVEATAVTPTDVGTVAPAQERRATQVAAEIGDNQAMAYDLLLKKGYQPHVAAGLVGNLMQESGRNINTAAVGDSGNAYGAVQWNGPRRRAYLAYAQEKGADPADLATQIDYLDQEMRGPESAAFEALQAAQTPEEAAQIASDKFWRPGVPMMENRRKYAQEVAQRFGGQPAGIPAAQPAVAAAQPQPGFDMSAALGPAIQLMNNEFATPGQRALAGAIVNRAMAVREGMTPYQQESLNLQRARFQAQLAGQIGSGGPVINVGPQGVNYGKPPSNFAWQRDQSGRVVLDERGAPIPIPLQNTKEFMAAQQAGEKAGKQAELEGRAAKIVSEDIDRALAIVEENPFFTTGLGGQLLSGIGGTQARDLEGLIGTIRGNIGFDRLQQMREASPTGGALGAVSERELATLESVLGNLETSQSAEQLSRNLERVGEIYDNIMRKFGAYPNAAEMGFAPVPEEAPAEMPPLIGTAEASEVTDAIPPVPEGTGITAEEWPMLWMQMTPEERALWQN